jgi:hypothetical protein
MFAHGAGGAYHVPLDRQLRAFRRFLSPRPCHERRNGDETAPLPDGSPFLVTALRNLADCWQLLAPL